MKRLFTPAALSAALALSLAPATGAWAAQNISITPAMSPVIYQVCGNATDTATGDCAATNASDGAAATPGNLVTVQSGAQAQGDIYGRRDETTTAATTGTNNAVLINGNAAFNNTVYGAMASSDADGYNAKAALNQVTISGAGAAAFMAIGGAATAQSGTATTPITASATQNQVLMQGGAADGASGGVAHCEDDCTAEARGNTVSVTGGTVSTGFAGGEAVVSGNGAATVSGNKVSVTGGSAQGDIYGGAAFSDSGAATVSNNTVEIGGSASIDPSTNLHGGYADVNTGTIISTGNALALGIGGVAVHDVNSFQVMNFSVPAATLTAGDPMLRVSGTADIGGVDINVTVAGSLAVGDQVLLIDASGAGGALTGTPASANSPQGYQLEIVGTPATSRQLIVQVKSLPPAATSSAAAVPMLGETALALLALLLAGGAMAAMRRR